MKALIINCSPVKTGATAEIVRIIDHEISSRFETKCICINDYSFEFCKGCRSCHKTAKCIMHDDVINILNEFNAADIIICVSPSYWADIPGQFKAFIDRCTPWCDTHEPHATIKEGKKGIKVNQGTKISYHKLQGILFDLNCYFGLKGCFTFGICGTCNKFNNSKYSDGKIGDCKSQRKFWCDSCDQYAEVGFWKI